MFTALTSLISMKSSLLLAFSGKNLLTEVELQQSTGTRFYHISLQGLLFEFSMENLHSKTFLWSFFETILESITLSKTQPEYSVSMFVLTVPPVYMWLLWYLFPITYSLKFVCRYMMRTFMPSVFNVGPHFLNLSIIYVSLLQIEKIEDFTSLS